MFQLLKQPYPFESSLLKRSIIAIGVGFFVFLFLYVFKPFELGTYEGSQLLLAGGYGLVTTLLITFFNLMMTFSFQNYFNEAGWTVGREFFWMFLLIALLGIANTVYTMLFGIGNFTFRSVFYFELYTISIGFFPILASIGFNYYRLKSGYESQSEKINSQIHEHEAHQKSADVLTENRLTAEATEDAVTIISENGKDRFDFITKDILFIKSADNYIEVFYLSKDAKISTELIRATLKKCETLFQNHPAFFRCHKSYLVNLTQVKKVSGNAQGYKLHLNHVEELIPVSRLHNETIKTKLERINNA